MLHGRRAPGSEDNTPILGDPHGDAACLRNSAVEGIFPLRQLDIMPAKKIEVCLLHLLYFPGLTTIFSTIRPSNPNKTHLPRTVVPNCGIPDSFSSGKSPVVTGSLSQDMSTV